MTRRGEENTDERYHWIDVSKDWLDAYSMARSEHRRFDYDGRCLRSLHRRIEISNAVLIVFEASGAYHKQLENSLSEEAVPYSKVNPRQARRFAEATGKTVKADKIDAAILAKTGAILELEPQAPKAEYRNALKELIARFDILSSIPGISKVTAFLILIEMPELGEMNGKQATCLAGFAPISRQSGKWPGKERIQGGRAFFRRAMYMPALCVIRHDLSAKRKYDPLVKAEKPPKVALTAILRKVVVVAKALLRDRRKWSENYA